MSQAFGSVLVTGATGLLGSELVKQLLEDHHCKQVICLVRDHVPKSRFFTEQLNQKCTVVHGDVRDQQLLDRIINEYEVRTIFHLAAQTLVVQANTRPTETFDVNIRGTWALLEAARINSKWVESVLIASSDKAYGNLAGEKYDENCPLAGEHPYDVSKSCADLLSQSYAKSFQLNVCVTRCGNFFGPGDLNPSRIFPSVIMAVLNNEPPVIRSNGKYIRDYIYVADGAAAYLALAQKMSDKTLRGEAFNFSYGLRLSVLDVVNTILRLMDSKLKPIILDGASNEIPVQSLDSAKAMARLEWKPKFGFEEGVLKTIAWYKEQFIEQFAQGLL